MTRYVVGIDGGGTHTRALVLDGEGRERGSARGSAGLVDPHRPGAAAKHIAETARRALEDAGAVLPATLLWAGLAGAGRKEVQRAVEEAIEHATVADRIVVRTDVEAAFHDAFEEGPGVILVAGTGSGALGVGEGGERARAGSLGAVLGDEGSGYHMGLSSLRAIVRAEDGRDPPTALDGAVLEDLALESVGDLVAWATHASKSEVARLAPLVAKVALEGDPPAQRILRECAEELRLLVATVIDRLGPWATPPRVALVGGAVEDEGSLRDLLISALEAEGYEVLRRTVVPARGAARLALDLL